MKLHNTLTRKVDDLRAIDPPIVSVYTCGPTVYDYAHIGHWFTYVRWDTLIRTLKASGLKPKWVMNITDVGHLVSDADEGEDKLEKGARREGKTAWEVAKFYTDDFLECMRLLNILEPNYMPRATEHIAEQIDLIKKLEEKGYTYTISDGVYYDTSKFEGYAAFARLDLDDQMAGARVEVNPEKRNPTDFALWKFSPKDHQRDMEWWSPWQRSGQTSDEKHFPGEQQKRKTDSEPKTAEQSELDSTGAAAVRGSWGFPGWHIECSAMSMKYLGETLDIHTGGIDHIPVHHTNEIAQSEAATGKRFANLWMHSNHVAVNGEKISKSLGNGIRLQQIVQKGYSPEVVRLHILESHYRSQSKFSWDSLEAAKHRLQNFKNAAALIWQAQPGPSAGTKRFDQELEHITGFLQDDMKTPLALASLNAFLDVLADYYTTKPLSTADVHAYKQFLQRVDELFGLNLAHGQDIELPVKALIAKREAARQTQDWGTADRLRDELSKKGVGVNDTPYGPIWFRH